MFAQTWAKDSLYINDKCVFSNKAYLDVDIDFGGGELFPHQHGVLWETPSSAPGLKVTPLPLGLLPPWVMPINCESFEKIIILSPGKWVCAICEPPQGASILN